jgi:hypothetical protein
MSMWPFGKKESSPAPQDVLVGEMTARYDAKLKYWIFQCDNIEFNLSGIPFDQRAFDWAKEACATIHSLEDEMRALVIQELEGWPCDKTKSEILSADLDDYAESQTMDIAFVGDESWGDFGVNVIITARRIVDVYGGD